MCIYKHKYLYFFFGHNGPTQTSDAWRSLGPKHPPGAIVTASSLLDPLVKKPTPPTLHTPAGPIPDPAAPAAAQPLSFDPPPRLAARRVGGCFPKMVWERPQAIMVSRSQTRSCPLGNLFLLLDRRLEWEGARQQFADSPGQTPWESGSIAASPGFGGIYIGGVQLA